MNAKCSYCSQVHPRKGSVCEGFSDEPDTVAPHGSVTRRITVLAVVCAGVIAGFYISLVFSATPLSRDERAEVATSIDILDRSGFTDEVFMLRRVAVFRSNDNWLNASVAKENAFAATNFPFEIVTLYPDFFTYPADSVERAAILLHEAKHLQGKDEPTAYEFVWKNRSKIGWTKAAYGSSEVWLNIRRQTREYMPNIFICDFNPDHDCTERP